MKMLRHRAGSRRLSGSEF